MVEVKFEYIGGLRCESTHGPSDSKLITDAPLDNHGKGEAFSPTDLVATALGTCVLTTMAIAAEKYGVKLDGSVGRVQKIMSTTPPRRIAQLVAVIEIPLPSSHPNRAQLEAAAHACPVQKSLHPETQVKIDFKWIG
jgi:putative redox protein